MWSPPPKYIARYMESNRFGQKDVSLPKKMKSLTWEDLPMSLKDGVETEKLNRKSTLVQAVTAQRIIHVDLFLDEDHEEEENQGEGEDKGTSKMTDLVGTARQMTFSLYQLYL
jgi:CO dehydrogenase/acetyl-CoA synthase beta subunit